MYVLRSELPLQVPENHSNFVIFKEKRNISCKVAVKNAAPRMANPARLERAISELENRWPIRWPTGPMKCRCGNSRIGLFVELWCERPDLNRHH